MMSSNVYAPSSVRLMSSRVRVLPRPDQPKQASTLPYSYDKYPQFEGEYGPPGHTKTDALVASYLAASDYASTTTDTALVCPCCFALDDEQQQHEHHGHQEQETYPLQEQTPRQQEQQLQQSQQPLQRPKRHLRKRQQLQQQQQLQQSQTQLQQQQFQQPPQQLLQPQPQLQQPQQQLQQPQQQVQHPQRKLHQRRRLQQSQQQQQQQQLQQQQQQQQRPDETFVLEQHDEDHFESESSTDTEDVDELNFYRSDSSILVPEIASRKYPSDLCINPLPVVALDGLRTYTENDANQAHTLLATSVLVASQEYKYLLAKLDHTINNLK